MKSIRHCVLTALILLFLVAGCAPSSRMVANPPQAIPVEIRQTPEVTVEWAEVTHQDGRVRIKGNLLRPWGMRLHGHVNVSFLGPDGSLLSEKELNVTAKSRRRGFQTLPFTRMFDLHLPEGTRAVVFYQAPLSEVKR
jgi:hypothetical protein